MAKYSVNTDEVLKASALTKHVVDKLSQVEAQLRKAKELLDTQSGIGVNDEREILRTQINKIAIQMNSLAHVTTYLESVVNTTKEASDKAKHEMESVELASLIEAAVVGAASEIENVCKNNEVDGVNNANTSGAISIGDSYYYAWSSGGIGGGCGIYSYAMILANLGVTNYNGEIVNPYDVLAANGNSVHIVNANIKKFGYDVETHYVNNMDYATKVSEIKTALSNHPEGIVLRWESGALYQTGREETTHFVVCTGVTENGEIIVNDPYYINRKGMVLSADNVSRLSNYKTFSAL